MTHAAAELVDFSAIILDLAAEYAAAAFTQDAAVLPRGCSEREAQDAAWTTLQAAGADYSTLAVATCQAAKLPDDLVRALTLAGNERFIRIYFEFAEAWRIGGTA